MAITAVFYLLHMVWPWINSKHGRLAMATSKKAFGDLRLNDDADYINITTPVVGSLSTSAGSSGPAASAQPGGGAFAAETITYSGSGLVFHNTYGTGVSAAFHDCIIAAENFFQSHSTNAVTINMNFDLKSMSNIYSASNNFYNVATVSYATLKSALQSHATTADDTAAVNSLPSADPSKGQGFHVTAGMARILGFEGASSSLDDDVALNSSLSWSYGQDAIGALEHEISEGALGRVGGLGVQNGWWAPMDLFRYSSSGQHDYTGGTDGKPTYFSVDGQTMLLQFHNALNTSGVFDQQDFADWGSTVGDAFGPGGPGSPGTVSNTDLRVLDILGWTPSSSGVTAQMIQNDYLAITRTSLALAQATSVVGSINAGTLTETKYVNDLLTQVADTTIPAVAVEGSMYGAVGSSAEVTMLATQFLPAQVSSATSHGYNPLVYASEALGLAFAFGNENGSTAFATAFGPAKAGMPSSAAGDAAFAAAASSAIFGAASTPNLVNAMDGYVTNWKAFYASHGIPGIVNATAAQVDLAARGAAWGDLVGVALTNNLGPLKGQATNFLEDAAHGTAVYSASLASQPSPGPFHAAAAAVVADDTNVQLTGVAAHVDHAVM
jgi:hypothetical protein